MIEGVSYMQYNNYDELVQRVRVFRLEHADLPPDELAKLILRTFKIDRTVIREIDGTSDLLDFAS